MSGGADFRSRNVSPTLSPLKDSKGSVASWDEITRGLGREFLRKFGLITEMDFGVLLEEERKIEEEKNEREEEEVVIVEEEKQIGDCFLKTKRDSELILLMVYRYPDWSCFAADRSNSIL